MNIVPTSMLFIAGLIASIIAGGACAANEPNDLNLDQHRTLLQGYDPVSYFSGEPRQGTAAHALKFGPGRVLFSSAENLEQFRTDPQRYLPAYGGYCAFGVRMGKKMAADHSSYVIARDRLFVLMNRATLKSWKQDQQRNIEIADRLWPSIRSTTESVRP